jgi:hypothetical protein
MNFDNFIQLGEGVQNLMLAYFDVEENEDIDVDEHNNNNLLIDNNNVDDNNNLEDFMEPEVAHLQMGFVHTHFLTVLEKQELFSEFSEEGMKLWDKYFAPHYKNGANLNESNIFKIPLSWFNFISLMLLSPKNFDLAKGFLCSPLWNILTESKNIEDSVTFVIPEKCCVQQKPSCKISEIYEEDEALTGMASADKEDTVEQDIPSVTPAAPKKKRRANLNLVESEVRRSPRISELNEGFKDHSNCNNKNCLPCNSAPPNLKSNLVKNLAVSFCKVNEDGLDKKILKSSKSRRVGVEDVALGPSKKAGKDSVKEGVNKSKGKKDVGASPQHGKKKA